MKKIKNYLLFIFASVFLLMGKTNAVLLTESEIPDGSYIIGSHMFTYSEDYPYTDLYDGNVNTAVVMLGSASFETEDIKSQDEFVIYNKLFEGFWLDTLSGDLIEADSYDFEILYVNGSCIDPSCSGKSYDITFRYNNDVTSNLVKTYNYLDVIEEPASPTKLGHKFLCWTLENSDDCYDFSTPVESDLVLEASWSAYEYEITYVDTVSNKTKVVECNFTAGNECTYPNFTDYFVLKEGYTFSGWSLATSGEKVYTSASNFKSLFGDTTKFSLYSIFNSSDYAISYNLNGGSFTSLQSPTTVYDPSELTYDISTPSKVGYQFAGWSVTKGDATVSNGLITINTVGNIEITANWTPNTYNVVYNGTNLNTTTCKYDTTCTLDLSKITVASGKQIKSITATVDGTAYSVGSTVKNLTVSNKANVPVTVTFEDIYYNISYELDGGTVASNPVKALINTSITLTAPTKTGYTFKGWTVSSGTATISGNTLKITAENDVKLTANWTANTYTLVYNSKTYATCSYDTACKLSDLTDTVTGKTFANWKYNGVILGSVVYNLTDKNNQTLTLEPVFDYVTYGITYDYDGGTVSSVNVNTYNVDTNSVPLNEPSKTGYTFKEWIVTSDNGLAKIENNNLSINNETGTIKVVATYKPVSFNVSYDLNGGTGSVTSHTCTYDSCTITSTVPTYAGYDFVGWVNSDTGYIYTTGSTVKIAATSDIELKAKWSDTKSYNIKYVLNGGTFDGTANTSFLTGESAKLTDASKTGYEFKGWLIDNTGEAVKELPAGYTKDVTVYASWVATEYNVTYKVSGYLDEADTEKTYKYDSTYTLEDFSDKFALKGYKLIGWSTSENGNLYYGKSLEFKNLNEGLTDMVLYPCVEDIKGDYVISYYLDGGSFVDNDTTIVNYYNSGETIPLPDVSKTGYKLTGWKLDDGTTIDGTEKDINRDVVVIPVWEKINSYTVSFVHEFDTSYTTSSITCTFDTECTLPTINFTREGYNFDGWLLQLTGEGGSSTYEDGDVFTMTWETAVDQGTFEFELTSQWSEIMYDVYYYNENNEKTVLTTYSYFDDSIKVSLNVDSKSDGSTFVAWSLEDGTILDVCTDDSNYACLSVTDLTSDINLIAHYSDELVTVAYNADYTYSDRGQEQTVSNNGTLSILPGMKITGLPESVSYQRGPNTTTVNIVGWTLDDVEIDLDEYVVTTDIELVAIFE